MLWCTSVIKHWRWEQRQNHQETHGAAHLEYTAQHGRTRRPCLNKLGEIHFTSYPLSPTCVLRHTHIPTYATHTQLIHKYKILKGESWVRLTVCLSLERELGKSPLPEALCLALIPPGGNLALWVALSSPAVFSQPCSGTLVLWKGLCFAHLLSMSSPGVKRIKGLKQQAPEVTD